MNIEGKRVKVFRTHEQSEEDFEYEGELLGIDVNNSSCIVLCDTGKLTAPYVTLCRVLGGTNEHI